MKLLQITDGITTIDFLDIASGYSLEEDGYAPAVANVETSQLAGRSRYTTVQDSMQILVHDTTTTTANENLIKLRLLMEKAERWGRGERVEPVRIRLQIAAGELPQENVIYAPSGNGSIMTLPPQHLSIDIVRISYPVTLNFTRRGEWLAYPENLIVNGGFEIIGQTDPEQSLNPFPSWKRVELLTIEQDNIVVQSGDFSAKFGSPGGLYRRFQQTVTGLAEGQVYTVRAYMRVDAITAGFPSRLRVLLPESATPVVLDEITTTGAWEALGGTFTATSTQEALIEFSFYTVAEGYLDSVTMVKGSTPLAWADGNEAFATSKPEPNPVVQTVSFLDNLPSSGYALPTDVSISYSIAGTQTSKYAHQTLLALSQDVNDFDLSALASWTVGLPTVSDTARNPYSTSGNVWTRNGSLAIGVNRAVFASKVVTEVTVFATVRTTDARAYSVNIQARAGRVSYVAPNTIIQSDGENPFIVNLGTLTSERAIDQLTFFINTPAGGTGTGALLVDSILAVNTGNELTRVVYLEDDRNITVGGDIFNLRSGIIPRVNFPEYEGAFFTGYRPSPVLNRVSFGSVSGFSVRGEPYQGDLNFATRGDSFAAVALTVNDTYWRRSNTSGATFDFSIQAIRAISELVPK